MAEQQQAGSGGRIVALAVDESDRAEQAFDWFMSTLMKDGDTIVLIHCPETYDLHLASPGVVEQLLKEVEKKVTILENKYREKVKGKIHGKFRTGAGKPGEVVVKLAKEENASMIITGTRGLGKIRRTILGSVSDYIIHHASVPVLVYRPPEDA